MALPRNLPALDERGRITLRAANSSSTDRSDTVAARCIELPPPSEEGGGAPEWVMLLPAGPEVEGRDGRKWRLDSAAEVAAASLDGAREVPIDWEHASDIKAPRGEEAPAAGWITQLEARNGALWGKVEWTERGAAQVAAREYRYLSPLFAYTAKDRVIKQVLSAGLTNNPNFRMTALNRNNGGNMDIKKILTALGLAEDATDEQAVAAVEKLKTDRDTARNSANILKSLDLAEDATDEQVVTAINTLKQKHAPSLEDFVPRADYDQAVAKVAKANKEALDNEIEAAITKALEAGKITPATADYHRAQCRAEGGLERFRKFVETAPEVARNTNLGGSKTAGKGAELTGDAAKIAGMFGHTAEDLKEYRT